MHQEHLALYLGLMGLFQCEPYLIHARSLVHRIQDALTAGLHSVFNFVAARIVKSAKQFRINSVHPRERCPPQVEVRDLRADVVYVGLAENEVVSNHGESTDSIGGSQVNKFRSDIGACSVLDLRLRGRAIPAGKRASAARYDVCHWYVRVGHPVGHNEVSPIKEMPRGERKPVYVTCRLTRRCTDGVSIREEAYPVNIVKRLRLRMI